MLPPSWSEAKAQGVRFYFTGLRCKNNHISPRYTRNGDCVTCVKEKPRRENQAKKLARMAEWRRRNVERIFLYNKTRNEIPEKAMANAAREWREAA